MDWSENRILQIFIRIIVIAYVGIAGRINGDRIRNSPIPCIHIHSLDGPLASRPFRILQIVFRITDKIAYMWITGRIKGDRGTLTHMSPTNDLDGPLASRPFRILQIAISFVVIAYVWIAGRINGDRGIRA